MQQHTVCFAHFISAHELMSSSASVGLHCLWCPRLSPRTAAFHPEAARFDFGALEKRHRKEKTIFLPVFCRFFVHPSRFQIRNKAEQHLVFILHLADDFLKNSDIEKNNNELETTGQISSPALFCWIFNFAVS